MGKIGKNRTIVGINCPNSVVPIIDQRANRLGWSRAKYATEIILKWEREGSPGVNSADELLQKYGTDNSGRSDG